MQRYLKYAGETFLKNADFLASVKDMLTGFPVVKSFRAEPEIEGIYQKKNKHY